MIDHNIISFYNDDPVDLKKEFKDEFNRLTEDGDEGLYTFLFSSYHEYTVNTEIVFCVIYEDTALFYVTPYSVQLNLDTNLMVTGGEVTPNGNLFETMFAEGEKSDVVHIGECCNSSGYVYGIYAFSYDKALKSAIAKVESERYNPEILVIDDQDMIDVSMDYLEQRIERFKEQVERSFELEEAVAGLDENPYSNEYYDDDGRRRARSGPMDSSRTLGDSNV
jgi:hypothetical protein